MLPIHIFQIFSERPVFYQLCKDQSKPHFSVSCNPGPVFGHSWIACLSLGPHSFLKRQKDGLDWTFKHYGLQIGTAKDCGFCFFFFFQSWTSLQFRQF